MRLLIHRCCQCMMMAQFCRRFSWIDTVRLLMFILMSIVLVEQPSVFSTDLLSDDLKLIVEVFDRVFSWREIISLIKLFIKLLPFLLGFFGLFLVGYQLIWVELITKLDRDHNVALLNLKNRFNLNIRSCGIRRGYFLASRHMLGRGGGCQNRKSLPQ